MTVVQKVSESSSGSSSEEEEFKDPEVKLGEPEQLQVENCGDSNRENICHGIRYHN